MTNIGTNCFQTSKHSNPGISYLRVRGRSTSDNYRNCTLFFGFFSTNSMNNDLVLCSGLKYLLIRRDHKVGLANKKAILLPNKYYKVLTV